MSFYSDEDVHEGIASGTRAFGLDTESYREHGTFGWTDARQLAKAVDLGRAIITSNKKDFRRLHEALLIWRLRWGVSGALCHHGLLIVPHLSLAELIQITVEFDGSFDLIDDRLFIWAERGG